MLESNLGFGGLESFEIYDVAHNRKHNYSGTNIVTNSIIRRHIGIANYWVLIVN